MKYLRNEPLNGFAPNSQGIRLVLYSEKFEGQGQFPQPACGLCLEKHRCSTFSDCFTSGYGLWVVLSDCKLPSCGIFLMLSLIHI